MRAERRSTDAVRVRKGDPAEIRGDATLLIELSGRRPEILLHQTLADLLVEAFETR
jgi:hypothetical protein